MLQKFAFALKSKTLELFDDDYTDLDDDADADTDAELIPNQRVIILKPDAPSFPSIFIQPLFSALSSFSAAYLLLQTAHSPLDPAAVCSADRSAVSLLRRLSLLKTSRQYTLLTTVLEAQIHDNQSLLRGLDALINRLQIEVDSKDAEAVGMRDSLFRLNSYNEKLLRMVDVSCDRVDSLLSISVFDGVLKDCCKAIHRFTRLFVEMMEDCGWDLDSAAEAVHPGVVYVKPGHCRYAILSYICLRMFQGFERCDFGEGVDGGEVRHQRSRSGSLRQFIEHSAVDPLEVMNTEPECGFSEFCKRKYEDVVNVGVECSLFGNLGCEESGLGELRLKNPLYEPFITMASAVWTLHKLGWAYDPVVGIFQVGRGKEFSMVYMERVAKSDGLKKVAFTVIPGFRVGKTVIQCRVYLDGL